MTGIQAVIFDLDGCLVDSEVLSLGAIAAEAQELGLPMQWTDLRDFLGVSLGRIMQELGTKLGRPVPEDFPERFETRLFAMYETQLHQVPGADALLRGLDDAGIALAIASGGSVRRVDLTLRTTGLAPWFGKNAFSADLVAQGKPAPDIFLHAARELGVAPAACAVFEDSPHGILGARNAGMRAVGFTGGAHLRGIEAAHARCLQEAGAQRIVTTLQEAGQALID